MEKVSWFWSRAETPAELHQLLETFGEHYPIREGRGGQRLSFHQNGQPGELKVTVSEDAATVAYGSLNCAARGLGLVLAGRQSAETVVFKTFGIMLDASRNAVMTVNHLKGWLRQLALMGYNMAMLYTEDTYQLPDEPYFGYMRGAYSMAEIKEIDAYAKRLGIEMIACIQALGHLEQIMQWSAYATVKDTNNVLLVDEDKTYRLIDKMIAFWSEALSCRRIHIGMDETHDLGRGRFMDQFGYQRGFDIFNRHLGMVNEICGKYGVNPMIWSDMYFRMGNQNLDYYDQKTVIPDDVKKQIPANVELVYWDYYHREKEFYLDWIQRHRDLGKEPLMGSGVWTWARLWCDHEMTVSTVKPCLDACRESKLSEVFFTMWGDDGAYCEFDSALAGLCWAAELSFGNDGADTQVEKTFRAVCGGNYKTHQVATMLEYSSPKDNISINAPCLIWDDPIMAKYVREQEKIRPDILPVLIAHYQRVIDGLKGRDNEIDGGDVRFAARTAILLLNKLSTRHKLVRAYRESDKKALAEIRARDIPEVIGDCRRFAEAFRTQWLRRNKPFGLDVIQNRLGGQLARWEELALRLGELAAGKVASIPELDATLEGVAGQEPNGGGWKKWALSANSIW